MTLLTNVPPIIVRVEVLWRTLIPPHGNEIPNVFLNLSGPRCPGGRFQSPQCGVSDTPPSDTPVFVCPSRLAAHYHVGAVEAVTKVVVLVFPEPCLARSSIH
jgi:hypothetical protein